MKQTLTVEEAGAALGIGRSLAYDAVRAGSIPSINIGRRILVPRAALDRLLTGTRAAEPAAPQLPTLPAA